MGWANRITVLRAMLTVAVWVALLLGAALEQWRTRKGIRPALARRALYDEKPPRGGYYWMMAALVLPSLVLPTRVRVLEEGLVVVTPTSYLFVPSGALIEARPTAWYEALLRGGVNLVSEPRKAVEIRRRGRVLPLMISVEDRERFLEALARAQAKALASSLAG